MSSRGAELRNCNERGSKDRGAAGTTIPGPQGPQSPLDRSSAGGHLGDGSSSPIDWSPSHAGLAEGPPLCPGAFLILPAPFLRRLFAGSSARLDLLGSTKQGEGASHRADGVRASSPEFSGLFPRVETQRPRRKAGARESPRAAASARRHDFSPETHHHLQPAAPRQQPPDNRAAVLAA